MLKGECRLQTPHHVSVDNFVAGKSLVLLTACLDYGDKQLQCALCGTRINWEVAFIAAHRVAEECVGTGTIVQVDIHTAQSARRRLMLEVACMSATGRIWQPNWTLEALWLGIWSGSKTRVLRFGVARRVAGPRRPLASHCPAKHPGR